MKIVLKEKREATKKHMGFLIHMANFEMFFRALGGEQISFFWKLIAH